MLEKLICILNNFSTEVMFLTEFFVVTSLLLLSLKFFGLGGLYAFLIVSLFVANIQVLKLVEYTFYPDPIALGKVVIASSFFAIDIIVECFGKEKAIGAIWLSLASNVMISLLMLVTIGYKPFISLDPSYSSFLIHNESIKDIFMPLPNVLAAGVISYLISQYTDTYLFSKIREKTKGKYLWFRSFIAPALSSFLDNVIFYSLAFYILSPTPLDLNVLIFSYICGTYFFRVFLIFLYSNVMYIAKFIVDSNKYKPTFLNKLFSPHDEKYFSRV